MSKRPPQTSVPARNLAGQRFARRAFLAVCGLFVTRATALAEPSPASTGNSYRVIVHPSNRLLSVERTFLADAFLKKRTAWPGGQRIQPVDQKRHAPARREFSRDVLKRSVEAVKEYWVQRIFSGGDVPPPELDSDDAVVEYVAQRVGAVGYVSPQTELRGTRVIEVL